MIQLCRYILLQGYSDDQITILTTYTGQMFLLREVCTVVFRTRVCIIITF